MCEDCLETVQDAKMLIDAVEKNRQALIDLLAQIHKDMGGNVIIIRSPDGSTRNIDFNQHPISQVLLLAYLSNFLIGECPADDTTVETLDSFASTGMTHGAAYAGVRAMRQN